jgi:hypothetical protein
MASYERVLAGILLAGSAKLFLTGDLFTGSGT